MTLKSVLFSVLLVSRRYSAASNSNRQDVRWTKTSQNEPGSVGSTKPVTLIAK